jgi:hypothetical protein
VILESYETELAQVSEAVLVLVFVRISLYVPLLVQIREAAASPRSFTPEYHSGNACCIPIPAVESDLTSVTRGGCPIEWARLQPKLFVRCFRSVAVGTLDSSLTRRYRYLTQRPQCTLYW